MKSNLFEHAQIPLPPSELKSAVLAAAQKATPIKIKKSWIDAVYENRSLRLAWLTAVVGLSLILALWNPEPGESPLQQNIRTTETLGVETDFLLRNPRNIAKQAMVRSMKEQSLELGGEL